MSDILSTLIHEHQKTNVCGSRVVNTTSASKMSFSDLYLQTQCYRLSDTVDTDTVDADLNMTGITSHAVLCLSIFTLLVRITYTQTSTVNGTAEFSGTPVATNPNGVPTLIYNCAKLPAICQNVNRTNPLQSRAGGRLGELQGNPFIELNFDTDPVRHRNRNSGVCPGTWKTTHACPEINQPNTVPGGSSYGSGSYPAARFIQPNLVQGNAGFNKIADATGGDSGMIWTCDEWPPAMYGIPDIFGNID